MPNDENDSGLGGEANWTPIPKDDPLWAPPDDVAPPVGDPAPAVLNTHEMEWDAFERLTLRMARTLDGPFDVRRYGTPGQKQFGLDVVGFFSDRRPSVYQSKRREEFGATDLEAAVVRYTSGRRPFDAERIVVVVASEARDTATIEKLAALRTQHPEIEIELWDRVEISERLREQPQIVTAFFGEATASLFCGGSFAAAAPDLGPISADAILRGPIAHLGLLDKVREAEASASSQPDRAAGIYGHIAEQLEASPFQSHAVRLREQEASALTSAGKAAEAAAVRLDLGWRLLEAGDPFSAQIQVREIAKLENELAEPIIRVTNALSAAAGFRHDYSVTLDHLATAFDELTEQDAHRTDAGLVLAEEAVSARKPDLVSTRAESLLALADSQANAVHGQLTAARIRMCVADCGGDWDTLAMNARTVYAPRITALVLARHARHLALTLRPEGSLARWLDAIERACLDGLYEDAAHWLYALRAVRVHYGLIEGDINDPHRHAQALRASGSGTILPEPYEARERALSKLREEKWPDALEALRRHLWRSTIGAQWSGELDAHELLGDLFARTGRGAEAARHYILGGNGKKLEELAAHLKDEPVHHATDLLLDAPWERTAALKFAAAAADLLVDEDAAAWCSIALREIAHAGGQTRKPFAPDPVLAAFKAFGHLALVSTEDDAGTFVRIGADLVPRAPNTYRFTDEGHATALIGIARAHPRLRPEAVEQLLKAALVDQRMADIALGATDLLRTEKELVERHFGQATADGHFNAALGLIIAEADTTPVAHLARERLNAATKPRVHEPGVQHFGTGLPTTALLVTTLPQEDRVTFARAMLLVAEDVEEPALNLQEALDAVMPVASALPDEIRDELFSAFLPFAQGARDGSRGDDSVLNTTDPLQRFRFNLGSSSLAPDGLRAVAALARNTDHHAAVQREAIRLLSNADETTCHAIAHALASLPAEAITLDVGLLAGHASPWLRALSAVLWAHRPSDDTELGPRLARDPSKHVRRSLASSLRKEALHAEPRRILAEDPRRSVRWQAMNSEL